MFGKGRRAEGVLCDVKKKKYLEPLTGEFRSFEDEHSHGPERCLVICLAVVFEPPLPHLWFKRLKGQPFHSLIKRIYLGIEGIHFDYEERKMKQAQKHSRQFSLLKIYQL